MESVAHWDHLNRQSWRRSWVIASRATGDLLITALVQCACWPTNVFYQMKLRDTFAPIGSYIVTADEIKDPHKLQIRLTNNGVVMQDFNTDDMALPLRFACAAVT